MTSSSSLSWSLEGAAVTDAGLIHLTGLKNLDWLSLKGTQVTDRGLVHLARLTKLKSLELSETRFTEDGVERLRLALPNAYIRNHSIRFFSDYDSP